MKNLPTEETDGLCLCVEVTVIPQRIDFTLS